MSVEIVEKELSYRVIGIAMDVHRGLGPGLEEFYYQNCGLLTVRSSKRICDTSTCHAGYSLTSARSNLKHAASGCNDFWRPGWVERILIYRIAPRIQGDHEFGRFFKSDASDPVGNQPFRDFRFAVESADRIS
jgi:hypothetical protein